jgi:pimeloyl-ACP methyl ester carboxylesterase
MTQPPKIRQACLHIDGRQVRYTRSGEGPPVLVVYPNAAALDSLIAHLSRRFTVFAFDNPGYGGSDALAATNLTIADLADALAASMRHLKFGGVPVFGTHLGAAIGIELGYRHPDLVAGLVLDGVPIFSAAEAADYRSDGYFDVIEPDILGGQFSRAWTRVRDWLIFEPWCRRTQAVLRLAGHTASAEDLHRESLAYFRSIAGFKSCYPAAFDFGSVAAERIAALTVPTLIMALSEDGLSQHLARLGTPRAGQTVVRLDAGEHEQRRLIGEWLARFDRGAPLPEAPPRTASRREWQGDFADLVDTQVFYRAIGDPADPPLIVLPDAPGSFCRLMEESKLLSRSHRVIGVDLPGTGRSDAAANPTGDIVNYNDALARLCVALQLDGVAIYASGFGSSVALEFARTHPELLRCLILRGILLPDEDERRRMQSSYAPPIRIGPMGEHWYATWLMLRDSLLYWPWYARGPGSVRTAPVRLDAGALHEWTVDVMARHEHYGDLIRCALAQDAGRILAAVTVPLLLWEDAHHPFCHYDPIARRLAPEGERVTATDLEAAIAAIEAFSRRATQRARATVQSPAATRGTAR